MSRSSGVTHNGRVTAAATRKRDRSESGDTLVEVLLALIILAMASVALIIAFGTSISASSTHRNLATFDTVLTSVSQNAISLIQQDGSLFINCPAVQSASGTAAIYQATPALALSAPAPYTNQFTITYTSVQYWDTTTTPSSPLFDNTCVTDTFQPELVQITALNKLTGATFTNSFVVDYPVTTSQESDSGQVASQLIYLTQPSATSSTQTSTAAGSPLATQPVVEVLGSTGNVVTTDLSPVTLSLNGGLSSGASNGATLSGCQGNEVLGVITFTGCTVNAQGVDYTITASVGTGDSSSTTISDITSTPSFSVGAAAGSLSFAGGQPVAGNSGSVFTSTPVVTVVGDSTFTGNITVTVSGGTLSNCTGNLSTINNVVTLPATTTGGVPSISLAGCTFAGTDYYNVANSLYTPVPYTLTATAATLLPATSSVFTVAGVGPAAQLVFSTEPTGVGSSSPSTAFSGQPAITVEDSYGNVITNPTATVALSISSGKTLGGATVAETLSNCSSSIVNNVAITFTGCAGSAYANGLTLTATTTSGATFTVTSTPFNITAAASQLVYAQQPAAGASGTAFTTEPIVNVEDASGNIVTAATAPITLTTSGGTLQFCSSLAPNSGVVTVKSCSFAGMVGTSYTLTASESGLTSATSAPFSPSIFGAAYKLVFVAGTPVAGNSGSLFTTQPVIKVEDSGGNVVTNSSAQITLTASPTSLVGLQSCSGLQSVAGVIDVAGCTFGGTVGTPYTLTAAPTVAGSLKSATSQTFSPTAPGPASSSTSTVVATPSTLKANGVATSTITVTLMDASDNPISGKSISISPNGGTNSTYTTAAVVTNSSGVATFSATDNTVELVTYTATDTSDSVVIGQTATVNFISVPTITGISPASRGQGATNQNLTLTGTNFVSGAAVTFSNSGVNVNSTTFNGPTSLTVNVTVASNASLGAGTVTETNPDTGTFTSGSIFTVNAAPIVSAVSPTSLNQGAISQTLTLTGTGFVSGATTAFSGSGITVNSTTYVSGTSLTVNVTIASGATVGTSTIAVTNPDAGNLASAAIFTVNAAPTVSAVSPTSLDAGAVNQNLTVTGTDFVSGTSLATAFSGSGITVNSTTYVSATSLTVNISISSGAATGTRTITVTNGDRSSATSGSIFTVNPVPTVTGVSPASRGQNASNQNLNVTGTGFVSGTSLATVFSGSGITVNSTTYVSATSLTVNISISSGAATGTRTITVTNGDGSTATSGSIFTVNAAPTVSGVSPASRGQGATNQNLTLTGTNFVSGAAVTFSNSGVSVNSTTFNSATTLIVNVTVAVNATVGTSTITVTNPDAGNVTTGAIFTVNAAPTVTGVTPSSLDAGAVSQTLTLNGTNFVSGATVLATGNGVTVNSTSFTSSTALSITVSVTSGATVTPSGFTVTNPDAGNVTNGAIFTVNAAPTVTGVSPASRDVGAVSQSLNVTGTGFVSGASLSTAFAGGGITVNSTTINSATSLTVNITILGSATPGARTFTVTNGDGSTATSGSIFTVNPAPTVTSSNPSTRGQGTSMQTLTLTGTNFVSGSSLATAFSGTGITVNSTSLTNSTTLSVVITVAGNATPGARTITVTNGDGTTASGSIFTVNAAPTVTSASPSSRGQGSSNQTVTLTGTGFESGATAIATGSGVTVISTGYTSATSLPITVNVASGATLTSSGFTVVNPDGGSVTSGSMFTVNPAPTVTGVSPSSRGQGASLQTLTLSGTNFVSGATVLATGNGVTVNSTSFTSSTALSLNVSVTSGATVTSSGFTVTNPDAGSVTTGAIFTVNAAPTVTAVSPTSLYLGTTSNLTLTGTNFVSGATTSFSASGITVNSTTWASATSLTVNVTVTSGATVGTSTITVTNPDAGSVTTGAIFTVNAAPTVSGVSPSSRDVASVNQSLTVTGTGFVSGASLATVFSGTGITVNSTTYVSATSLTVNISIASGAATGTRTFTVTNGDGSMATSGSIFTVNPAPTVTVVTPSSEAHPGTGSSTFTLTVTGTNFVTGASLATAFTGNGITVNSTTFTNSTTLSVSITISSSATPGSRTITVTNGDGTTATNASIFSVT